MPQKNNFLLNLYLEINDAIRIESEQKSQKPIPKSITFVVNKI